MLDRLLEQAEKISRIIVWIGGGMLIFAAVMTTLEVILRKFANFSFGGADEIAGYIFAISTYFAFAFATLHRAHVRIDALYIRLPQPIRLFLDVFGFLLLGGFLLLMAERSYNVLWNSFEYRNQAYIFPEGAFLHEQGAPQDSPYQFRFPPCWDLSYQV